MILVTLGTHPQPMDRLVRTLDELVGRGAIEDEVLVQAAAFGYRPTNLRVLPIVPYGELVTLIRRADVVVSHAGPGLLSMIRREGKWPVVLPRSAHLGEHVDDHQERYAERLRRMPGYVVLDDLEDLPQSLSIARNATTSYEAPDVSRAVQALNDLIRR